MQIAIIVNGAAHAHEVEDRTLLVQYLREACELTGTKVGCDTSSCGACTVLVDGAAQCSCLLLTVEMAGKSITTIEGLRSDQRLAPIHSTRWVPALSLTDSMRSTGRETLFLRAT